MGVSLYSAYEHWKGGIGTYTEDSRGCSFSNPKAGLIPSGLEHSHCFIIIENDKAWVLLTAVTLCDFRESNLSLAILCLVHAEGMHGFSSGIIGHLHEEPS